MGSRIMHVIIANKIAENISIADKGEFLIGGVAPDATNPKDASHFFIGDHNDFTRSIDYEGFLKKYQHSAYVMGYYTHLIADYVWLHGFYHGWLKNRMSVDETLYQKYHQDFRLLNGKLLDHYRIDERILESVNIANIHDLEEVSAEEVKAFIPYVIGDMNYSKKDLETDLGVFTFQQIIGYLETSAEMGIAKIKALGVTL
ncbi:zinc dependent phospholipase C family protein [Ornithinibacillus scapharcae]|uniref:zinc dependent phospholipase C family protein n=1 Tax=Ornithinibacillus scapharcae TaxID=1147159 RepID=UPI000225ADCB|nr:zinc dependent phospholipase C family protein [Ornithinibacillus scapharcae]